MHRVCQHQAVNTARHLNIRKKQGDVRARLKNGDCFIGVNRFNRVKSGILDNVDGTHAQDHLVLDDKNVRHLG